ncbi:MAG: DNA polymerase III subunit alpha [Phycisphaerae bacterium]
MTDKTTTAHKPFVHLHLHTEYSLLDGACRISSTVARAKELNMPALTISDHGNMFGAIEFYTACIAAGIKPIIGCELYISPTDRFDKSMGGGKDASFHLLLLAQNLAGYQNLIKLCSIGYREGFYYKPRIDHEVLRAFSTGLICTSTCLGGQIPQKFMREDKAAAKKMAETYLDIFGPDRFFMELQNHGLQEQKDLNPELVDLANRLGVGTIATNDVHYLTHDDVEAHDVLCCISTRAKVADENRFKFETDQFYLKSYDEMLQALPEYEDALQNTLRIADMCDIEFDFNQRFAPAYPTPKNAPADDYLRELVYEGAKKRYAEITDEIRERIDYELSVVSGKGFSGYFLIVWDFIRYARDNGIPVNTRGSGCSTVVGYCLEISDVDPLRYGLYFERFMDPERDEMPDIDVDICMDRRQDVINYVREKYGHVAQIITFGRLKPKAAIRDICRVMDIDLQRTDSIAKLVPEELKMTLDKAVEREPELKRLYAEDATIRKVIDIGKRLEGMARHASVHAAGVVVADVALDTLIPLYKPSDADEKDVMTQFEGPTVEKVGLLKMDFLGLRTLSQIQRAVDLIAQHHGETIDVAKLDLTDQRVYELLARGETRGIFQFESGGMRDVLMKMRPNRIEDLIAANALYRPGPMEYIDEYVARKHGKKWTTPHQTMTEVLAETYGIMVYQEQVSRLVNRLGDVPLRRAFRLAKAISKKKESMINAERGPFLEGCEKNGVSRKVGEQIFDDILKFGGYAFNKAHSTGYAIVAYQTAWLKTYYPVEFMAAVLTYESGNTEKIAGYIDECRRLRQADGSIGIPVLPPDVNESDEAFTVVYPVASGVSAGRSSQANGADGRETAVRKDARRGHVRFGLAAISGVGKKAVEKIRAARGDSDRLRTGPPHSNDRLRTGPPHSNDRLRTGSPASNDRLRTGSSPSNDRLRTGSPASNGADAKAKKSASINAKTGPFRDLFDFCERVDLQSVNKGVLENLIKAGAFDTTGAMRRALITVLEQAMELGNQAQRDARAGQLSMFGGGLTEPVEPPPIPAIEWTDAEMLAYEKATLGFYITKHPLTNYEDVVRTFSTANTSQLPAMARNAAANGSGDRFKSGPEVRLAGLISRLRPVIIKQGRSAGKKMMVLTIEDFEGSVEAVVFPDRLDDEMQKLLKPDTVVFVEGTLDTRREDPSIRANAIVPIEDARRKYAHCLIVKMRSVARKDGVLPDLKALCLDHRGQCQLYFEVETPSGATATLKAREAGHVDPSPLVIERLREMMGAENLVFCGPRGVVGE